MADQTNTSAFDPESFLDSTTDQAGSTVVTPVPVGEHKAQLKDISKPRQETSAKDGRTFVVMDITWQILDEQMALSLGREPTSRQGIFLDLNPQGKLDMGEGKNVQLNRVRAAVGQNISGKAWAPVNMIGQVATVTIAHRPDKNDPEIKYDFVKKVGMAS